MSSSNPNYQTHSSPCTISRERRARLFFSSSFPNSEDGHWRRLSAIYSLQANCPASVPPTDSCCPDQTPNVPNVLTLLFHQKRMTQNHNQIENPVKDRLHVALIDPDRLKLDPIIVQKRRYLSSASSSITILASPSTSRLLSLINHNPSAPLSLGKGRCHHRGWAVPPQGPASGELPPTTSPRLRLERGQKGSCGEPGP